MWGQGVECGMAGVRNSRRWKRTQSALRRKGEQGCGEEKTRVCEVNNERKKQERDQWRGCISRTFQANYFAPSPPFPSIVCSHCSLTFSVSALTIHVLSTARDPLNDTSLHWRVLSSRATIGKRDPRKDKVEPAKSVNSRHGWGAPLSGGSSLPSSGGRLNRDSIKRCWWQLATLLHGGEKNWLKGVVHLCTAWLVMSSCCGAVFVSSVFIKLWEEEIRHGVKLSNFAFRSRPLFLWLLCYVKYLTHCIRLILLIHVNTFFYQCGEKHFIFTAWSWGL